MTVLVVNDHEMQLNLMKKQLSHAGHTVILCFSGKEAIEKLKLNKIDVVITDMEMSGMTGEELLAHIRQTYGSLPVILMSGNHGNLRKKGFDGYLAKPFSMQDLLTVVDNALK